MNNDSVTTERKEERKFLLIIFVENTNYIEKQIFILKLQNLRLLFLFTIQFFRFIKVCFYLQMKMKSFLAFLVLSLSYKLILGRDIEREMTIEVQPGREECFYQDIIAGETLDLEYQVCSCTQYFYSHHFIF